jgi:hypothetical protein
MPLYHLHFSVAQGDLAGSGYLESHLPLLVLFFAFQYDRKSRSS